MRRKRKDPESDEYVESCLVDKIRYWMLKIILELGGIRALLNKNNYFAMDNISYFLGINEILDNDDETKKVRLLKKLKKSYNSLKNKTDFSTSKTLEKNIKQLAQLMDLNRYEEKVLEFVILLNQYDMLDRTTDLMGDKLNTRQIKRVLGKILNIPQTAMDEIFHSSSKFSKSSLVTIDRRGIDSLSGKIDLISIDFADNMLNLDEDILVMIKDSVRICEKGGLKLADYTHLKKEIDILLPYLQNSLDTKRKGVNILLYGPPGTGKTELAKTLAGSLGIKLFEISYADENEEPIDGSQRLKAYKMAQAMLANQQTLLMYDEAEDIFESSSGGFFSPPTRQKDKAWINRVLETNSIPTVWITNNVSSIDKAIVRRFDMSIEVAVPPRAKREEIIKKYSDKLIDSSIIKTLSYNEDIAPALVSRTTKVLSSIANTKNMDKNEAFLQLLNNTLKAQGYDSIKKSKSDFLPNSYDPNFINTTTNLKDLTYGIKKTQNARICLYGVAGTGKSAFGKYIAHILDKTVILKKASDLQSKWVGECEKNIARAFEEAKEEKAVLIFDEVDSFLSSREDAKASWEVSQVNEMLVQMENFDGVFIATTNLMDNLDSASLRRFDLKLEFKFLNKTQSWNIFVSYAKELGFKTINDNYKKEVQRLRYLTPGDFATIKRQNRFRPVKSLKDFISRLEEEINIKQIDSKNKMGFVEL